MAYFDGTSWEVCCRTQTWFTLVIQLPDTDRPYVKILIIIIIIIIIIIFFLIPNTADIHFSLHVLVVWEYEVADTQHGPD
jgi:uncharacterized integral membrane protein